MKYWFTADTHFNHEHIIEYCNRPFKDAKEMNEVMIERWNERVTPADCVYHIGDFGFLRGQGLTPNAGIKKLLRSLNGSVHLILGNHDHQNYNVEVKNCFASTADIRDKTIDGQRIIMCHYAMRTWPGRDKGSWMLYGHSHGKLSELDHKSIDVGVDCHNFYPLSFDEVKHLMETKQTIKDL
jgi:calcineurin-like phosphoesterase family protein